MAKDSKKCKHTSLVEVQPNTKVNLVSIGISCSAGVYP